MRFVDPALNVALDAWAADFDPHQRAAGQNYVFDERIGDARRDALEAMARVYVAAMRPYPIRRAAEDYYQDYVRTGSPVAHPFMAMNAAANLAGLAGDLAFVRVENIKRPLDDLKARLKDVEEALAKRSAGGDAFLQNLAAALNRDPRNAVSFAAHRDQLLEEIADPDWPHRLRDRLGLSYPSGAGPGDPVALMVYPLEDVARDAVAHPDRAQTFCIPTALDAGPNWLFFPTPKELSFGCPMALFPIRDSSELITEILHPRLTYRLEHIVKAGMISLPPPAPDFRELRDGHLVALWSEAGRDNFGREL